MMDREADALEALLLVGRGLDTGAAFTVLHLKDSGDVAMYDGNGSQVDCVPHGRPATVIIIEEVAGG